MNRIVRHNYPVEKLPEDLREGLEGSRVTITVEDVAAAAEGTPNVSLEEILSRRRPPFLSAEEIDERLRRDRDDWDR